MSNLKSFVIAQGEEKPVGVQNVREEGAFIVADLTKKDGTIYGTGKWPISRVIRIFTSAVVDAEAVSADAGA